MRYLVPEEVRAKRGNVKYLDDLRQLARNNRNLQNKSELIMWNILRNKKMGCIFLRQKPIGKFILDFYCSKLLLVVEIDGGSHNDKKYIDFERDRYLEQRGIKTIRYTDCEVLNDIEKVKMDLKKKIEERKRDL